MKVTLCVDALQPELTGIGRYTWELWKGLSKHPEISLAAYRGNKLVRDPGLLMVEPAPRSPLRRPRVLERWGAQRRLQSSLVHGPNYFLPEAASLGVVTVHDLSVLRHPETHPPSRLESFERLFGSSVSRASHLITDTQTVRSELIEAFSLAPERVSAVPLGVDSRFNPRATAEIALALSQWGLRAGSYGLSVAAFEPRKKLVELIVAWGRLPTQLRTRFPLILAGGAGWKNDDLHQQIVKAQSEGWLKHLGFVPDELLADLYGGARLFVYPSIYEGFGLPPLEAMASATPVIVSNRSCLPEVCGDAALFIDPDDPDAFTSAIEEVLEDDRLSAAMVDRGLARARIYDWESCIEGTVAVYRKTSTEFI